MIHFDIGVWTTYDLHRRGNGDPEAVLDGFITETFEEMDCSIDLNVHSTHPNPPNESVSSPDEWPITIKFPCPSYNGPVTYDNLLDWWSDWHACHGESHADANLLVSHYDSTAGLTTGNCDDPHNHLCVAEGSKVGDLDGESLQSSGPELRYSQMYATVIHELGHAIIDETQTTACSNNITESRMGNSWTDPYSGGTYTTPMVTWDNNIGSENECCTDLAPEPANPYWTRSFSQCAEDHITNCSNK